MSPTIEDGGPAHGFEARPAPNGGWMLLNYRSYLSADQAVPLAAFSSTSDMLLWLHQQLITEPKTELLESLYRAARRSRGRVGE